MCGVLHREVCGVLDREVCGVLDREVCGVLHREVCGVLDREVCGVLHREVCGVLDREVCGVLHREVCGVLDREVCGVLDREVCDVLDREVCGVLHREVCGVLHREVCGILDHATTYLYHGHTSSEATSLMLAPVRPETGMNIRSDVWEGREREGGIEGENITLVAFKIKLYICTCLWVEPNFFQKRCEFCFAFLIPKWIHTHHSITKQCALNTWDHTFLRPKKRLGRPFC